MIHDRLLLFSVTKDVYKKEAKIEKLRIWKQDKLIQSIQKVSKF